MISTNNNNKKKEHVSRNETPILCYSSTLNNEQSSNDNNSYKQKDLTQFVSKMTSKIKVSPEKISKLMRYKEVANKTINNKTLIKSLQNSKI